MKTPVSLLSSALLFAMTSSVLAASSIDLTVKGLIIPGACTPTLDNQGVIDHGKISAQDIDQDTGKYLRSILPMQVDCEAKTQFALRGTDNRADSAPHPSYYGLGLINNTQKIGHYELMFLDAVADQAAVEPLESTDNGQTWHDSAEGIWLPQNLAAFGEKIGGTWAPKPLQHLTTDLHVFTRINPAKNLDLSNEVTIDGSATIEIKYL